MKTTIKFEEAFMLLLGLYLFSSLSISWWWFAGLFLAPDIGMLGYVLNNKTGALTYNLLHHKGLAIAVYFVGLYMDNETVVFAGILLFSHSAFDRMMGYGLKYADSFTNTHLGKIGK